MGVRIGLDRLLAELTPDQVRSLLLRLAGELETDLTAERVEAFYDEMTELSDDDDALLEGAVEDEGQTVPLLLEFFKNATTADELLVVAPPRIVAHVQREIESLVASPKVRVIPGG